MSPVSYLLDYLVFFVSFSSLINNLTLLCKCLDTESVFLFFIFLINFIGLYLQ